MGTPAMNSDTAVSDRLVAAWLAAQTKENTRAAYRIDLNTFGLWCAQRGGVPLAADIATLSAFGRARLAAVDSDATMRRRWSSLSSFYQYAVDLGHLPSNPVDGINRATERVRQPSDTEVLTMEAVDAYLAMASALDPRLDALVSLLVLDGIKLGEALALEIDDIARRPPKTSLTIRRNGKSRKVVLTEASARAVHRCAGKRRNQPLFVSANQSAGAGSPQRLSRFGADHLIRQLRDGNDGRVTANAFRRFYMISKHASGATVDEVRDDAGLVDSRSVVRYLVAPPADP